MSLSTTTRPDKGTLSDRVLKVKRSVELPANVIVILIIAVMVLLGLIMFFFNNYIKLSPPIIGLSKNTSEELKGVLPCSNLSEFVIKRMCISACYKIGHGYRYIGEYHIMNVLGVIKCKCSNISNIEYVEIECQ